MNIKASAEDASWTVREAAWDLEERLLWRGRDAASKALRRRGGRVLERGGSVAGQAREHAQDALDRAQDAVSPLQRLIQTKLTWPLADAVRERGTAARAGIATAAVATAVTAGVAGAISGAPEHSSAPGSPAAVPAIAPVVQTANSEPALQGVVPEFEPAAKAPPPAAAPEPSAPPARVAWRFANAFVLYEVGRSSKETATAFAETAEPALANSLAASPPRLPTGTKVPEARVLNVVLADRTKDQLTASVSLARLRAVSEVRLTLTHTEKHGWRVVQVLG